MATNQLPPRQNPNEEMEGEHLGTDSKSKTVMIAAERGDQIRITGVISSGNSRKVPHELEVLQRTEPYYGPKLLTYAPVTGEERNFLFTAPGPNTQLQLWREDVSEDGKRKGWHEFVEVTASLEPEQPPFERCDQCGEVIRSIQHERAALSGQCDRRETWD